MVNPAMQSRWTGRLITALLWALAAASVVFWASRMADRDATMVVSEAKAPVSPGDVRAHQSAVARLLGARPLAAAGPSSVAGPAERFSLLGVIANVAGQGVALISVDGQPARPHRVGAQIAPGYRLQAVGRREAVLADDAQGPVQTILSLPALGTVSALAESSAVAAFPAFAEPAAVAPAAVAEPVAAAPSVAGQSASVGPPPRADSRRQPPASLQRSERRGP